MYVCMYVYICVNIYTYVYIYMAYILHIMDVDISSLWHMAPYGTFTACVGDTRCAATHLLSYSSVTALQDVVGH